jgi:hypothetical protein
MLLDCTIDSDKRACPTAAAAVLLNLNPGFWDTSMTILLKVLLRFKLPRALKFSRMF